MPAADIDLDPYLTEPGEYVIRIETTVPDQPVWAFVSETNNVTHHFKTITPQ